jgi:FkbM family methyltransferase
MRKQIRSFLQKFGYDIVKYNPPFIPGKLDIESIETEFKWLKRYQFKTIIDVGANEGQFSDKMHILFPNATIYAFEPLPGAFQKLVKNFAVINSFKAFNTGLGEQKGEFEIEENEYTPSSSFLGLSESHIKNFETAIKTKTVTVSVDTMDNVFREIPLASPVLLKIDVQGFEDKVIAGALNTISKTSMIICELTFVELYKGQPLFTDIFEKITSLGFKYSGSIEQLHSPETNQILQADGVFIKY